MFKLNGFLKTPLFIWTVFPSGNTFAIHLLRSLWPDLPAVHHFHTIAPLKIALRKDIPVFILLREPADAITSNYLKHFSLRNDKEYHLKNENRKLLASLAVNYKNYYQYVLKKTQQLHVIHFNDLVDYPEKVMLTINQALPEEFRESTGKVQEVVNEAKNQSFGSNDKFGASLPNTEKEQFKDNLKKALKELPVYEQTLNVYNQILPYTINVR